MRTNKRCLGLLALGVMVGGAGCNVDGRWQPLGPRTGARLVDSSATSAAGPRVDITIINASEVDLVESLVTARSQYRRDLEQLHDYYLAHGYAQKAQWAAFELDGLRRTKQFRYVLDAEVPSHSLQASDMSPDADTLYNHALELMRKGGHGVPALYRQDRMVEAANEFRDLIETYPSSDKIDDAAFYLGEIHKDYLPGQEEIAAKWYERAWTWNPQTPHPARFEAAVVSDYRLHDRDRALELYRHVAADEDAEPANARAAVRRIHELTAGDNGSASASRRSQP